MRCALPAFPPSPYVDVLTSPTPHLFLCPPFVPPCACAFAAPADSEVGGFHYGQGHPMKPHRVRMAHNLIVQYNLYKEMDVFRPPLVDAGELTKFHSDDYINFLRAVTPDNMHDHLRQLQRFNVGEDCPVFDGLFEFCQISASGSIGALCIAACAGLGDCPHPPFPDPPNPHTFAPLPALQSFPCPPPPPAITNTCPLPPSRPRTKPAGGANRINNGECDIAINWAGGLHHAKKSEASGFCYVNDCVLGILELLKHHQRVLYIDIDIHHGDGVEEAFYNSNRVMTLSLHKFGEYFPGTGDWRDTGFGKGEGYSVNGPLRDGMDDESYRYVFRPVLDRIMTRFQPTAVLLQCGADSLAGDRLGCFNLSLRGHGDCVAAVKEYGVPILCVGGGGYTMRNVARCWAYETSVLLGQEIPDELPYNEFFEYYGPDYRLHITPSNMENCNSKEYLDFLRTKMLRQLDSLEAVPGVQINTGQSGTDVPRDAVYDAISREELLPADARMRDEGELSPP